MIWVYLSRGAKPESAMHKSYNFTILVIPVRCEHYFETEVVPYYVKNNLKWSVEIVFPWNTLDNSGRSFGSYSGVFDEICGKNIFGASVAIETLLVRISKEYSESKCIYCIYNSSGGISRISNNSSQRIPVNLHLLFDFVRFCQIL